MRKLLYKLTGWLVKKTNYALPIEPVTITPANMKKFHAQRLIPWHEWNSSYVIPVYFQQEFKSQIVNEFIKEIDINKEEVPEGILYTADLLFKSL
jgi:hypothetical protein